MAKTTNKAVNKQEVKLDKPDELQFDVNSYSGGLKGALEAILFTVSKGHSVAELATSLAVKPAEITKALNDLASDYERAGRGFELREFDGLWKYFSAPEYGDVVTHFVIGDTETKLSPAALETLAIIAYRQPVTRAEIANIRGVNVDGVVRTLLQRSFIEEAISNAKKGEEIHEHAAKYMTTSLFLEKLGISSLAELEPLAPFLPDDYTEIPEFDDIRKTR